MAAFFDRRSSGLRPHFKAHKCLDIARRQRELGIVGMTAQIPYEAVVLAEAGFDDVLLSNQVVGKGKVGQVAEAAGKTRLTLAVDSEDTIAAVRGLPVGVVVEVNVGLPRGGAPPEQAVDLAATARRAGLDVRGVQGYEGHAVMVEDRAKREALVRSSMQILLDVARAVAAQIVTARCTGTY